MLSAATLVCAVAVTAPKRAITDEGGVSFWVPGFFGSLAATPQVPGWSLATIYYHTSVNAGADVAFARQDSAGGITANFRANLTASLDADADLGFVIPSYLNLKGYKEFEAKHRAEGWNAWLTFAISPAAPTAPPPAPRPRIIK